VRYSPRGGQDAAEQQQLGPNSSSNDESGRARIARSRDVSAGASSGHAHRSGSAHSRGAGAGAGAGAERQLKEINRVESAGSERSGLFGSEASFRHGRDQVLPCLLPAAPAAAPAAATAPAPAPAPVPSPAPASAAEPRAPRTQGEGMERSGASYGRIS